MQARFVRMGRRVAPWLASGILSLSLVACAATYRNHGYIPEPAELDQVAIGASREDVAALIGRPSAAGLLNDVGWFYVQSRWEHKGGRAPLEIDRQVVAITFTEAGTVANVERFGLERGRIVPLSRRVTDSNIKGISFLRQLFGSIGRLRADQIVD